MSRYDPTEAARTRTPVALSAYDLEHAYGLNMLTVKIYVGADASDGSGWATAVNIGDACGADDDEDDDSDLCDGDCECVIRFDDDDDASPLHLEYNKAIWVLFEM